jgi:DeoR/GlpR family transcriptional regulator of sugar metabolism
MLNGLGRIQRCGEDHVHAYGQAERRAHILDIVAARRFSSNEDLATQLGVSVETIRRDVTALAGRQALHRVRGGAAASFGAGEALFEDRQGMNQAAKETIAQLAARLVTAGQTVVIDLGTTAVQVARTLAAQFQGTVATTSLLVAAELAGRRGIEVLICGGRVRGGDLSCSNNQAVEFFSNLHADVAFIGSGGIDAQHGLTDFHFDEASTRRHIIAGARRCYVLADSSKFGAIAPYAVCPLGDLDGLICETPPPPDIVNALTREGGQVISD